jgi:hypothetical protein
MKRVPAAEGQHSDEAAGRQPGRGTKDAFAGDAENDRQAERERRQCASRHARDQLMKPAGVLPDVDDLVMALGCDEQRDGHHHQHQRRTIEIARMLRQIHKAVPKNAAELESQQDLSPQHKHASFVERRLDELRNRFGMTALLVQSLVHNHPSFAAGLVPWAFSPEPAPGQSPGPRPGIRPGGTLIRGHPRPATPGFAR